MAHESTARVITIPASEQPEEIKLKVAAYCRVSSSSDEQLNSFAAQNRYYTELISGKCNWQLVDIYADAGITGTSIEKRDDFKRMLHDCERGLIDRIDDCINKKVKKNTGQLPMYLVQNHHEGIISREIFDAAQAELARRNAGKSPSKKNAPTGRSRYSSKYALTDRLYCGECGTRYQRCTWRNHDGSKRIVWRCVSRVDYGHKYCHNSPTLDEVPLQNAILAAINKSASEKSNIVYLLNSAMEKELAPISGQALSISDIEHRLEELKAEFDKLLVKAANIEDQSALNDRFRSVLQEQTELKLKRDELQNALINNDALSLRMTACKQALDTVPATITDWDEALIRQVVDSVRVDVDGTISVTLKSGKTVLEKVDR